MEGVNHLQSIWNCSRYAKPRIAGIYFLVSITRQIKNGEKYGEPFFMELKIFHDIIGAHCNDMIIWDGINKVAFGRTETKCPT